MTTNFETKEFGYKARYLESNKETYITNVIVDGDVISFDFQSTPSAGCYPVSIESSENVTVEDGVARLMFRSPSGKTVICYADNRLYDSKYLKTHEVA